jgi:molybdopterin converting factor small subunit
MKARLGSELLIPIALPCSVNEVISTLASKGAWVGGARLAVNERFANESDTVREGDTVAVVPPVSGGGR